MNITSLQAEEMLMQRGGELTAKSVQQLHLAAFGDEEAAEDAMLKIVEQELREGKRPSL